MKKAERSPDGVSHGLLSLYEVLHLIGALTVHLFTKKAEVNKQKMSQQLWVYKQMRTLTRLKS